ncbi:hypothetical protein Tco_1334193, partial [Tanacetum coccineum]
PLAKLVAVDSQIRLMVHSSNPVIGCLNAEVNKGPETVCTRFKPEFPIFDKMKGVGELLEGLIPYSQRHYTRIDIFERSTLLLLDDPDVEAVYAPLPTSLHLQCGTTGLSLEANEENNYFTTLTFQIYWHRFQIGRRPSRKTQTLDLNFESGVSRRVSSQCLDTVVTDGTMLLGYTNVVNAVSCAPQARGSRQTPAASSVLAESVGNKCPRWKA